jgi:hypothetical protein
MPIEQEVYNKIEGLIREKFRESHKCIMEERMRVVENSLTRGDEKFGSMKEDISSIKDSQAKNNAWLIGLMGGMVVNLVIMLINFYVR